MSALIKIMMENLIPLIPSENPLPISQLSSLVNETMKKLFSDFELINFIQLDYDGPQLYQVHAHKNDISIFPVINIFGELIHFSLDRDGDGLGDAYEIVCGLNPFDSDSDKDGFPDGLEIENKGDAKNPKIGPKILKMEHDAEAGVMVITVKTCKGKAFLIEANPNGKKDNWYPLGEAINGNGHDLEFNIPDNDFLSNVMIRVGIENSPKPAVRNAPDKPRKKSNKCNVPSTLKGKEIIVGQGRRLVFRNTRRGELIEGGALGNMVTPFSYTFSRPDHCKGKLVLTFSNRHSIETVVYQLTFVNKGASGAYIANKFDQGKKKSRSRGLHNFDELVNSFYFSKIINFRHRKLTDAEHTMNATFAKCSTEEFVSMIVKICFIAKSPREKLIPEIKKK